MNDYAFGNFLYTLRTEKQLSQTQLAEMLGVTNKAVSKWENGASKPNTNLIPRLAKILDVSVEELFAAKRFEKNKELEQMKIHLAGQKKKYAVLSSVFFAMAVILPLLMIEFVCVMMGFQIPDEVLGPVGAMGLIFAFFAALVAFFIYQSNYRHSWMPGDLLLKPSLVKWCRVAIVCCAAGLPNLVIGTAAVYYLLADLFEKTMVAAIFLSVASLLLILLLGATVCLLRIKRLMRICFEAKRIPIPFRQRLLWLKVCTVAAVGLFPLSLCLQFTVHSRLRYMVMLVWLFCVLVVMIKSFRKK